MTEETLTDLFLNSLTKDIRPETKLFHPRDLEEAMQSAVEVEKKNEIIIG